MLLSKEKLCRVLAHQIPVEEVVQELLSTGISEDDAKMLLIEQLAEMLAATQLESKRIGSN